ncbi:MAG: NAD-dependent epimerase/dehydratase family protein [Patescibacteria group bacterium]
MTGSSGFVGRNLLRELHHRFPEAQINCLARNQNKPNENTGVRFFPIDYLNIDSLLDSEAFYGADYLFHVAGITKAATKKAFWEGNVIPTKNILETIRIKEIKLRRFIYVSSQSASGPSSEIHHYKAENEDEDPVELYGRSKLEGERLVKEYGNIIPFTIISPSSIFGPGDVDFYGIFKMTDYGINLYAGNRGKYFSLIYIDDLTKGIADAAMSENTINKKYFLCNDAPVTWNQIQERVFQIAGKSKINIYIPYHLILCASVFGSLYSIITRRSALVNLNKVLLAKPKYWILSNKNAKKDFGFSCRYSIDTGLRLTYEWYKTNGWI